MRHALLLRAVFSASLLLVNVGATSRAFAAEPTPQDIAQARELGQQAQAAFDAGNFADSEKLWTGAANLYPAAPTLTLGLARTQAKLGKFVLAQENYNKIIREQSQNANAPPAFKDALEAAKTEVGAVSSKIASVVIVVEGPSDPVVTLDGQAVSSAGLGLKRPVDPGTHVVKAEAPGYEPAEVSFQVAESGAAEAKLSLKQSAEAPAAATTTDASSAGSSDKVDVQSKGGNKTLAIVALGVGGAGLVFGSVTGILALGKHGDLSDRCPEGRCTSDMSGDIDSYKTMGTLSTIGFIVGGVGVAAGAVLWFTAPKERTAALSSPSRRASTSGVSWQPYFTGTGGGVAGRF